jgi:lipoprotein-anchoring transpeptidase ErfK/SrfK
LAKGSVKINSSNRKDTKPFNEETTHQSLWSRACVVPSHILFSLLLVAVFFAACGPIPTPVTSPTATIFLTLTDTATATVRPSPSPTLTLTPTPEPGWYQPLDPSYRVLKYQYAEVVNRKARVYVSFQDAVAKTGNFGYIPEYPAYVAYTTDRASADGRIFYLSHYGWMDGADLQNLSPSPFTGILLTRVVPFRFGWVLADIQSINAAGTPIQTYSRYQVVHEVPAETQNPGYIAVGADEWLPDDKVALANAGGGQVPEEAGEDTCRFIYVNLAEQTMTVYDKCKLVFATLISSGANSWTFEGRFAIQYKDAEYKILWPPATSTSTFYIEGVPYFMSYAGDFGFHGAYWHDAFGTPASHGCINLSPADAKWLYQWAGLGEQVIISAGK